ILFGGNKQSIDFSAFSRKKAADTEFKVRLKGGKEIEGKPVTLLCVLFNEYCVKNSGLTPSLTADYKRFRKLVKTGLLYEYIQRIWFAEKGEEISRAEAKKLMFTVAFSSYRYCPEGKVILKKYLPSIVAVIDGFKKEAIRFYEGSGVRSEGSVESCLLSGESAANQNKPLCPSDISPRDGRRASAEARDKGNASFAVMLQQVESVVFVDKILAECHLRGLKVLSKHDSIVCRQCDKRYVTALILRVLNKILGRNTYILDIDGEVWELRKKRKSRVGRAADQIVMTLFGISGLANGPPSGVRGEELGASSEVRQLAVVGDVPGDGRFTDYGKRGSGSTLLDRGFDRSLREKGSLEGVVCRSHRVELLRRKIMGLDR
ncbi:MAG: hypothetical protein P8M34_12880, partial [Saprospiraceae bacterium]|nr:hypothetical protein [Saprospiraceae bacterium]